MASTADWSQLIATTAPKYLKGAENNIMRQRKLLAMMQAKGRVKFNVTGRKLVWDIEYKQPPMAVFDNASTVDYTPRDRFKQAELDWRSYYMTDLVGYQDQLLNAGPEQIVNRYGTVIESMSKAMADQFGNELYTNGGSGPNNRIHGLETIFQTDATPVLLQNGAVKPNGTYANLSTLPQAYGGNWSGSGLTPGPTAWPIGTGDVEFDFFSPTIVNYTDPTTGVWSAGTKTWTNTCQEAMRFGITYTRRTASMDGQLDLILLNEELYRQFKNSIQFNLQTQRNQPAGLVALGFTDAIQFDGIDVASEYGIPAGTGYGLNTMQMELNCNAGQLFMPKGPNWEDRTYAWLFSIAFFGNLRFNPKFFCKFKNFS